ncbi:MAG TPA: DinB family protein [Streptosporangiaceae bacterium]|nr:DinB family protein [Streptosporangiaceae bacterium]
MTTDATEPPLAPDELASNRPEREVLEAFLDMYREIIRRKVAGLPEDQLRQRLVPSRTTLAGLIQHLTAVEQEWFQLVLAQRPAEEVAGRPADDGWALRRGKTADRMIEEYDRACAASREVAAGFGLDDAAPHPRLGHVSLRWVYVHLIEETARHAGHADILREQTDGATGFDG